MQYHCHFEVVVAKGNHDKGDCQGRWGLEDQVDNKLRYLQYPSFTIYYTGAVPKLNKENPKP